VELGAGFIGKALVCGDSLFGIALDALLMRT
jgi:hypothetical protein